MRLAPATAHPRVPRSASASGNSLASYRARGFEIEFSLDRQHQIDQAERGQPARAQIVIGFDCFVDLFSIQDFAHERGNAIGDAFVGAVEQLSLRIVSFAG